MNVDVRCLENVVKLRKADLFQLKMGHVDGDIFEEVPLRRLEFPHEQTFQLVDTVERLRWARVKVEQEMYDQVFAEMILLVDQAVKRENLDAIVELSVFGTWY